MNTQTFRQELDARIAKYDLLCHPFYENWKQGTLKKHEIRDYACDYYHHVAAFPEYLDKFQRRLPEGELRAQVLENKADEEGVQAKDKRSHAEIWVDFAEGMGATRDQVLNHKPVAEISALINHFNRTADSASIAETLASFYAYESQIPKVAAEKERGLKEMYGADDKTSYYFQIHKTFDVIHSQTWIDLMLAEIAEDSEKQEAALNAAENSARALWNALDGIERERQLAA